MVGVGSGEKKAPERIALQKMEIIKEFNHGSSHLQSIRRGAGKNCDSRDRQGQNQSVFYVGTKVVMLACRQWETMDGV
jgi:hypothetical protein